MCSSGGGGGSTPTAQDISDAVSDNTPDIKVEPPPPIKVDPGDISDTISDITPDIKVTDTSTGDIVKQVDKVYQGSDIDTTAEGLQEAGQLLIDAADSVVSGKPKGGVKDAQESLAETKDKGDELVDKTKETASNLIDPNNPNSLLNTTVNQSLDNATSIASNISRNFKQRMAKEGFKTLDSNYDPSLDDPYLMMRRGGRRKRGREKAIRQGALRIPSSGIGVQIPA